MKACLDILLSKNYLLDLYIDCEEVYLINIVDALTGELLNLTPIRALEWREAAYIKWLEEMRRMRRYTESDNLILGAVRVELWRSMATIAV